jgi:hypothetical protein
VIDDDAALGHLRQSLGDHGADVVIVADAEEDDLATGGRLGHRDGRSTAVLGDPALRLLGRAVEHRDLVAGGLQVPGHRVAHDAQANERDLHA